MIDCRLHVCKRQKNRGLISNVNKWLTVNITIIILTRHCKVRHLLANGHCKIEAKTAGQNYFKT